MDKSTSLYIYGTDIKRHVNRIPEKFNANKFGNLDKTDKSSLKT